MIGYVICAFLGLCAGAFVAINWMANVAGEMLADDIKRGWTECEGKYYQLTELKSKESK